MIYNDLYNIITTYIFTPDLVQSGSYYELITILLSSIGCIFVMAIPFILVYKIIKIFI